MESRGRTLLNLQRLARELLNAIGRRPCVLAFERERPENQKVVPGTRSFGLPYYGYLQ